MNDELKICIPQFVSDDEAAEAARVAMAENQRNAPSPFEIAGVPSKFWHPGRVLRCRFLDGDPAVHARVEAAAREWTRHANIVLDFGDDPDAEIRISFAGRGSWSYVGTDALTRPPGTPTMNFGWLRADSSDEEVQRVVLHEFGHALGMIHEHQHPEAGFEWDRDAVLAYYTGPPNNWSVAKTEHNVLNRYSKTVTQFTAFDVNSIMLYPIPEAHTKGDFAVDWRNAALSDLDKAFAAQAYPADSLPFDAAVLAPNNKLYVFRGPNYIRLTPGGDIDPGYPKPIKDNWRGWPAAFEDGIDAAMRFTDDKLYFFKGGQFLRYTMGRGVDEGYPQSIATGWRELIF